MLLPLNVNTPTYALTYFLTQPVLLLLQLWVVLEIYWPRCSRAIRASRFSGRGFLMGTFAVGILASLWLHLTEFNVHGGPQIIVRVYLTGESTFYTILLVFLLTLGVFLLWFPVPLKKNMVHYLLVFSVFFAAASLGLYMGNRNPTSLAARLGSALRMGIDTACLAAWVFLFRAAWEQKTSGVSFAVTGTQQAKVLHQLESMNEAILRARKTS
ncbi:MAG: hypothetical protein QM757_06045 [Paludibaculum sp.]